MQEQLKEIERSQSFQLHKSFETRLQTLEEAEKHMQKRSDLTEANVFEFRNESFTNMNQVEKIFMKKLEVLRRAIQDLCR